MKKGLLVAAIILACVLVGIGIATRKTLAPSHPASPTKTVGKSATTHTPSPMESFDMHAHNTTIASSLWIVVNKSHPLNPKTYVPATLSVPTIPLRRNISSDERQVNTVMKPALEAMVTAASEEGVHLNLQSGYRSYTFQANLYNSYVRSQGQVMADRQSARPGYSEHQTGLAADLGGTSVAACNVAQCFATTVEGKWLMAHAYEYGFIVRYPADKEAVTGYEYEPWHVRYVDTALSREMHGRGIETLEEFFGISGGTQYAD
jgi:D-alanyl-D-alanine carboxypeptidase